MTLPFITIELSKFKGYESKHDIYTFKSEFEKLVQPRVQKTLWLHVLKNNYLEGPALVLVDKLETIDEAWKILTWAKTQISTHGLGANDQSIFDYQ